MTTGTKKTSGGLMMFRRINGAPEVLIAHMGGPFYGHKDNGFWSMPKGEAKDGEDLLAAAIREFEEETGLRPAGPFTPLGQSETKTGKTIHAWAFEGDCDPDKIVSNTFTVEWPPRSGKMQEFPENDKAMFAPLDIAREKLHEAQMVFLDRLEEALKAESR